MNVFWQAMYGDVLPKAVILLGLVFGVVITGVWIAIRDKAFDWKRLGDFIVELILPKFFGWLAVEVPVKLMASFGSAFVPESAGWSLEAVIGIAWTVYAAVFATLLGHLFSNLYELNILPKATGLFASPDVKRY